MISLFHPDLDSSARAEIAKVLASRWLGQGPVVDRLEAAFAAHAPGTTSVAVSSATAGLHLAYILAGIGPGDEVITPVFTCVATNTPLLQLGAKIVFADVDPKTLNVDPGSVDASISERTKAIVAVQYGGDASRLDELRKIARARGIPLISDAAQALGASCQGQALTEWADFTVFSFQATKHVTSGDGGMLCVRDPQLAARARRLRWFGIDRVARQTASTEVDITELGYKYQMNDIAAALVLGGLEEFSRRLARRRALFDRYRRGLAGVGGIEIAARQTPAEGHAAWTMTVHVEQRDAFARKLAGEGVETGKLHFRNDRYTIFADSRRPLPHMDLCDGTYLSLPLHPRLSDEDVDRICTIIRSGW